MKSFTFIITSAPIKSSILEDNNEQLFLILTDKFIYIYTSNYNYFSPKNNYVNIIVEIARLYNITLGVGKGKRSITRMSTYC